MPWSILHNYHINVNFVQSLDSSLSTVNHHKVFAYCTCFIDLPQSSISFQFQQVVQTGNKLVSEI
jgi:hypothetical protein